MPTIKKVTRKWAITQKRSIKQQLQDGIRYLDLRVCKAEDDNLYLCHSLVADRIETVIKEIGEFADDHKKEILLIDFNHFYGMTDQSHTSLIQLVLHHLGPHLCPKSAQLSQLTPEMLWTREVATLQTLSLPLFLF